MSSRMRLCRVCIAVGTRPEAVKLAPLVWTLRALPEEFEVTVIATAQHRQMLDQMLDLFRIKVDDDLGLERSNPSLSHLTGQICEAMEVRLVRYRPDIMIVQGDTTTAFAAALAAMYQKVAIGHVEAGLRSHDNRNPFPEEANRRLVTVLTDLHFAPTAWARGKLIAEGVPHQRIVVSGNTVVDTLLSICERADAFQSPHLPDTLFKDRRVILLTSHRRESLGEDLENICLAIRDLVVKFPDVAVIYPVHMNPVVRQTVNQMLSGTERVFLLDPLDYLSFVQLMRRCYLILTDSGGLQEEAPTFHKPVLVLRKVTERPEASRHGMARVIGMARDSIVSHATQLLSETEAYRAMSEGDNPYGDGQASQRIVRALRRWHAGLTPYLPPEMEFHCEAKQSIPVGASLSVEGT
jgi:UDP-N-acetylglucosamine 2-epimerase (non-hydrolysing)